MKNFPYILKTGSLKKFFEGIDKVNIPQKVTYRYLYSIGFRSTNDRPILSVLKFIKFLDSSGVPTVYYTNYRDKSKSATILGKAIKESYSDLFNVYPDAEKQDNKTLRNFFSTHTNLGERSMKSVVETFKTLCSIAKFEGVSYENDREFAKEELSEENLMTKTLVHEINFALSNGRKARILIPEDITEGEIQKLKSLLDALK